ncbi:hypothetical protein LG047_15205 [Methylocystis sp. WRRC1]|uniref:hypothetical protein n=1 Tax=Methylocystis sp. WRRC1 TaxID=1732014 RepID=UPI001D150BDC|nr:hypothetical protein [Methylocystis sp. WRRC1]MCC3246648.1 hypothetical protein [Methylocystis sp. WRRC1]
MLRQFLASTVILMAAMALLVGVAVLAGCNRIEGAGFSNSGSYQGPVKCVETRPGLTRCYSVAR